MSEPVCEITVPPQRPRLEETLLRTQFRLPSFSFVARIYFPLRQQMLQNIVRAPATIEGSLT
jgi:hypothetical protein